MISYPEWRHANPIPGIISHSDEEVNEIDLNTLSGDALQLQNEMDFMLNHVFLLFYLMSIVC